MRSALNARRRADDRKSELTSSTGSSRGWSAAIGRIEIILACDPDESEQRIAPRIPDCCTHAQRIGDPGRRTDWPIGCNPLAG